MKDKDKTKQQLINELTELRSRIAKEVIWLSLLERANDGVVVLQDGIVRYANNAAAEMGDYTVDEIVDKPLLEMVAPESRNLIAERYKARLEGKEVPIRYEAKLLRKSGEVVEVEISGGVVRYQGRPADMAIIRDITEHKQAEKRLQNHYEQEKELRQRLEGEIKRRVEFIRALAHELKTPVTPMLASSELLVSELPGGPSARLARNIKEGASTLDRKIDVLLDLTRAELGLFQLNYNQVNPLQLLHKVAEGMSPVASSRKLSLVLEVPSSLPSV
ncbi:MAG TPA: PAS domain S-box protein [Dehalococcoidia bacterium]|nr:PAS domain S-box protein [Dehalococcoidia bacterium]